MDPKKIKHSIIRVNHAGEYAAKYIYKGQICASKKDSALQESLKEMLNTELEHLNFFSSKIIQENSRPSLFLPLWKVLGFGLGYSTAFFGKKSAMACTVAVEDVIEKHYASQLDLMQSANIKDDDLAKNIARIRSEEIDHKDTGIASQAEKLNFYKPLSAIVKFGCKLGISISKRL
jgi:ubiquinone biosynthesis monooxygenase Coq7